MKSHIALEAKSGMLAMKPDASLNITEKNPMFNDTEMFSQPFELPLDKNRHLMKNIEDLNSTLRAEDVNGERIRVIMDGIPIRSATMKVQDDVVIDNSIDVNLDATNRTFKDMIQDLKCREVSVDNDIIIGEKIGDVQVDFDYTEKYVAIISCWAGDGVRGYEIIMKQDKMSEVFQPFALGYSFPGECYENATTHEADPATDTKKATKTYPNPNKQDVLSGSSITVKVPNVKTSYINVSQPYPAAKYCNSRIAYAHHKVEQEDNKPNGETSDEIVPASERNKDIQEDKSPYWVLPADRPASGICFYVAYFLERLFKTLGVAYDMTALTDIEDFNYLAFMNTQCHYDAVPKAGVVLTSEEQINKWLESRGCGGKITLNDNQPKEEENLYKDGLHSYTIAAGTWKEWKVTGDHGSYNQFVSKDITNSDGSISVVWLANPMSKTIVPGTEETPAPEHYQNLMRSYTTDNATMQAKVMQMFATSDNFPDASVTEIIESLENSFGVRFCYDAETNKVTVKLLRDMFRSTATPIKFKGKVLSMKKKIENIRGIRMKYSAEDDAKEQREYVRTGKRDYDTTYNYIDYNEKYTKLATYDEVTQNVDVGNRNGYCDLQTGDFFRIKVASDASTVAELRPAVFEVGQFHGVELGDCSKEAEDDDAIKEFVSQFEPVMVNDVSYRGKNYREQEDPLLVPYIDEDMEHEFLVKKMLNPVSTKWGNIDIIYELCMAECYDPTQTDDGQSPLQHYEWGLTVGFLRLGTLDDTVVEYDRGYDGFDNSKWLVTSKNYALTADTFDEHGNFLGTNPAGSFSLKPRAWKPFLYYIDENNVTHITTDLSLEGKPVADGSQYTWLIPCYEDERDQQGIITARRRSRGMCDTWMIEFFHFLLNRQRYEVKALCTAAELADIPNHWLRRYEVDGKTGWFNQYEYTVNEETGIGEVTFDFFAL